MRQQREYDALLNARLKLQAKLNTIRQEQKELEAAIRLAESKEKTVEAIKKVDDVAGIGDADIASIREKIYSRLDRATAESEMYAGRLDNQMDDALGSAELDLQLEERKRRLGLAEAPALSIEDEEEEADSIASEQG